MRHLNMRISGRLATLGLVIAVVALLLALAPAPPASLDNVRWTLTYLEVNGQVHALVPNVPVTLTFHEKDQTITGSSGINSYQATYQRHGSQVRFHDFATTLVGCGGSACSASKEQEDLYLQALMQAETLLVSGKSMTVTGAGGQDILRFSTS